MALFHLAKRVDSVVKRFRCGIGDYLFWYAKRQVEVCKYRQLYLEKELGHLREQHRYTVALMRPDGRVRQLDRRRRIVGMLPSIAEGR